MNKIFYLALSLFISVFAMCSCSKPSEIKIVKLGDYTPLDVQAVKLNVSDEPLFFNNCYCTSNGVVLMQLSNTALPCVYLFDYQGNLIAKGCPPGRGRGDLRRGQDRGADHRHSGHHGAQRLPGPADGMVAFYRELRL